MGGLVDASRASGGCKLRESCLVRAGWSAQSFDAILYSASSKEKRWRCGMWNSVRIRLHRVRSNLTLRVRARREVRFDLFYQPQYARIAAEEKQRQQQVHGFILVQERERGEGEGTMWLTGRGVPCSCRVPLSALSLRAVALATLSYHRAIIITIHLSSLFNLFPRNLISSSSSSSPPHSSCCFSTSDRAEQIPADTTSRHPLPTISRLVQRSVGIPPGMLSQMTAH
jgi:hypothetical protein